MWLVSDSFPLAPSPGLKPSLNAEAIVWGTASGTYCSPNAETLLAKYRPTTAPLAESPPANSPHWGANKMPQPALNKGLDKCVEVLITSSGGFELGSVLFH